MKNDELNHLSGPDAQALLNKIVVDYLKEKKSKKRWRWIFRSIFALIILFASYQLFYADGEEAGGRSKPHVGLIDLNGEIFDGKEANADDFAKGLDAAYKNKGLKALIIRVNSPGGSPVQAEYMFNSIRYYEEQYPDVPVYAVCVDLCASAAYYVAAAAKDIYASPSSMVGSIGVLYNGFGFVDLMSKVGVSRRLQTAGTNKGFLDPFSPVSDEQKNKLQTMLDLVHEQFIKRVKEGRGDRLKIDNDLFSGLFWTGEQAIRKGLIDGYSSSGQLARDVIKIDYIVDYTHKPSLFDKVTKNLGTAMADSLVQSLGLKPALQ